MSDNDADGRKTFVTGDRMRCPRCDGPMEAKDTRRYETLAEHVGAPNREPSMKVGYGCADPECEAADTRWLHDGEGPFRYWDHAWGRGANWYPVGTWHHHYATSTPDSESSPQKNTPDRTQPAEG